MRARAWMREGRGVAWVEVQKVLYINKHGTILLRERKNLTANRTNNTRCKHTRAQQKCKNESIFSGRLVLYRVTV